MLAGPAWMRRSALALALLAAPILPGASISATAAVVHGQTARPDGGLIHIGNFKTKFDVKWTFKTAYVHRCLSISVSGYITYTLSYTPGYRGTSTDWWSNQDLHNPALKVSFKRLGSDGKCLSAAKVAKVTMRQAWTGYECSFNPGLSFSYPWGVSISGWPSCGQRKQASYKSDPPGSYSSYHQYNSGSPGSFASYSETVDIPAGSKRHDPCYGVYSNFKVYVSNNSDSYRSGTGKVCLAWHNPS
jgi:hypothetical protein